MLLHNYIYPWSDQGILRKLSGVEVLKGRIVDLYRLHFITLLFNITQLSLRLNRLRHKSLMLLL